MRNRFREWFKGRGGRDDVSDAQPVGSRSADVDASRSADASPRTAFDDYDDRDYERVWQDENTPGR